MYGHRGPPQLRGFFQLSWALLVAACAGQESGSGEANADSGQDRPGSAAEIVLEREMGRIDAAAASVDSVFQPLPLLRPAEEESLREYSNAAQVARGRALGVERGLAAERLRALEEEGALVRLTDSDHWVVRDLDHSQPLVVPGARDLLTEIGERFQGRLAQLGAPPFRMEVSSVLRTAEDQASLRRVNPNAALGESAHEYGTTFDLLYSAFAAPAEPIVAIEASEAAWAAEPLRRYAEVAAERVAARRAMELKAVLGQVLREMQREGRVMVTLERQQPVFHMTLAR